LYHFPTTGNRSPVNAIQLNQSNNKQLSELHRRGTPLAERAAPMNPQKTSQAGYSLAEMLTVVAIIGVLALVMVPNFMNFRNQNKMRTSLRNFASDLRTTRQLAITEGKQAALVFGTGKGARTYNYYLGDRAFGSTLWTPQTGTGSKPARGTRLLDDIAYFPANSAQTPQSFPNDLLKCDDPANVPNCVTGNGLSQPPNSLSDSLLDVVFFPDGRVFLPAGTTNATITIKTDLSKLSKPQFSVFVTPTGRVVSCSCALNSSGVCPQTCQ
jgi:prepilin-type N-terminal cleavage/methylation domain-containing protein